VHFTKTADGSVKIGPTSVPAFWRENYVGFKNFKPLEAIPVLLCEAKLFLLNSFNFRKLAFEEIRKYSRAYLLNTAQELVHQKLDNNFQVLPAGIRAQLLNKKTNELVMDFVLEHTKKATHILNAVSPAFTCAFSFAEYVVEEILKNRSNNE
jgi:L-2-hydroxyglutarate oxidase LhgO